MNESELCAEATELDWRLAVQLDFSPPFLLISRLSAQPSAEAGLPRDTHPRQCRTDKIVL